MLVVGPEVRDVQCVAGAEPRLLEVAPLAEFLAEHPTPAPGEPRLQLLQPVLRGCQVRARVLRVRPVPKEVRT